MTKLDRRHVLGLLVSSALSTTLARTAAAGPLDQGIGGTGLAPPAEGSDRGIGGTGVIGTIRKFGSIYVNDLRISYPETAEVRVDGQPASLADLRIGQVVRVSAFGPDDALATRQIDISSEVVGPIEKVGKRELTVLGQTVSMARIKARGLQVGDTVAVSGLRQTDGTIVASIVQRRDGAPSRVSGPVILGGDGVARIGNLPLSGVGPDLVGRRAIVYGQAAGGTFAVSQGTSEAALFPSTVRSLSIESYVSRRDGQLEVGSGFNVGNAGGVDVPAGRSVRAVLRTSIGADGRLTVSSYRQISRANEIPSRVGENRLGERAGGGSKRERFRDGGRSGPGGRGDTPAHQHHGGEGHRGENHGGRHGGFGRGGHRFGGGPGAGHGAGPGANRSGGRGFGGETPRGDRIPMDFGRAPGRGPGGAGGGPRGGGVPAGGQGPFGGLPARGGFGGPGGGFGGGPGGGGGGRR